MSALDALRTDRRRRLLATVTGAVVGLALAPLHWSGLLLAGALVALPQRSVPRGVAAGLGVGVAVVVVFLAWLVVAGTLGPVLGMGQPAWLALGIGLALPAFGAVVRGVV